jgi:hypothetical protein
MIPPLDPDSDLAAATIGFIAYHKAVPIIDFRYLGAASHLTLDWEDPWYSKFDNVNLKRHHASALMTFLYVEPYEVRHEILTRVKDLEEWMDLGLRGDEFIELDELGPLMQRIGDFMLARKTFEPIFNSVAATGITQPLVGYKVFELVEVADVNLELHVDAIVEHVDLGDVGCGFCAGQVDPVCLCGRHGESCCQQQEDAELFRNGMH